MCPYVSGEHEKNWDATEHFFAGASLSAWRTQTTGTLSEKANRKNTKRKTELPSQTQRSITGKGGKREPLV